ncbi:hypothetical protein A2Z23_02425 [Candidatus Curtissbacteria bacterium RBG_16_39_7]|uniref:Glycoside hydrolase family 57 N-terminal domain-containing protein n=1 Tax=Candidatus Curtissbacteria bacterium RBG_16_39_7 TaxID=1797707 RepID=A0A1F5G4L2_9BACT|nr:MAG: hypothetical protein A2Z23_02425 [Candidatus Curtissbacteria bacterium RBG_16_39_7]
MKMVWANFLHFYQPPDQSKLMLDKVVNEGYRPLLAVLKSHPREKITVNFSGCLTELLVACGYSDVIRNVKFLAGRDQIEFTASAKYHPFLPLLSHKEVLRQIRLNEETNKKFFGRVYAPRGFYSPEAGFSFELAKLVRKLGYHWTIVDEVSYSGRIALGDYNFSSTPGFYSGGIDLKRIVGTVSSKKKFVDASAKLSINTERAERVDYSKIYKLAGLSNFLVFFRERVISDALASGQIKSADQFLEILGKEYKENRYLLTGTDGEAYGHHQPGLEKVLDEIYSRKIFKTVTISELPKYFKTCEVVSPYPSSWGTTEKEVQDKNYYSRWFHPDNAIHKMQWDFTNFAINIVAKAKERKDKNYKEARKKLDFALYSCHFWWASAHPWWSIEMIERGAYALLGTVNTCQTVTYAEKRKAKRYYHNIIETAFDWLRKEIVWDLSHQHN